MLRLRSWAESPDDASDMESAREATRNPENPSVEAALFAESQTVPFSNHRRGGGGVLANPAQRVLYCYSAFLLSCGAISAL